MRTVHFIAIGGSAMHNLAIALHQQGFDVTGSDDEIFEPSRSRLERLNLLPDKLGWDPLRIHKGIDAVILGMHARADNPELVRAQELGIPVFSYPSYFHEQHQGQDPRGDRRQPWQDHHHQHDRPCAAACGRGVRLPRGRTTRRLRLHGEA